MLIHPTAVIGDPPEHRDHRWNMPGLPPEIADTATIEAFCTVDAGVNEPTKIGPRSWLMKGCHVGHDAVIGWDCELAPHTVIGGHAVLEDGVRCGIGVLVKPYVTIGEGARLGMGAVVLEDVPAGEVWVGNPAYRLRHAATGSVLTVTELQGWEKYAEAVSEATAAVRGRS
jgi:acyl-[acyl carrier protein]--UDP-N-acetylglucosamine O-acyltransferase